MLAAAQMKYRSLICPVWFSYTLCPPPWICLWCNLPASRLSCISSSGSMASSSERSGTGEEPPHKFVLLWFRGIYVHFDHSPSLHPPFENVFRQCTKMRRAEQVYSQENAFLSPFSFFTLKSLFFNFFPAAIKPPNVMFFIVKMELVNPISRIRIWPSKTKPDPDTSSEENRIRIQPSKKKPRSGSNLIFTQ